MAVDTAKTGCNLVHHTDEFCSVAAAYVVCKNGSGFVCTLNKKACKQIKVLKEYPLSQLELALLKDMSAERRKEGIAIAEEIEVKYRREGKFFDEILKGE